MRTLGGMEDPTILCMSSRVARNHTWNISKILCNHSANLMRANETSAPRLRQYKRGLYNAAGSKLIRCPMCKYKRRKDRIAIQQVK